ncbi:aldose 1-epimerase family protein [Hymenobacter saemangeumensis]|uniref:Aldose 1-epimerase family protein n=1 Tax=Hymenobacter saemangeumensis TaxID=1084522 RepID=A0ABP8IR68_9BACT
MYTLASATARATFAAHGAELTSFISTPTGLEYIWQAEPGVWARHAPVLFPIVGRLSEDTYLHHGQAYKLSQHGFARDREFAVLRHSDTELAFQLTDDEASRAAYPFAFELTITYTLREASLTVQWEVRNPAKTDELLFSIGAHPAFRCPLLPEEQFDDYYFAFDHPVSLERHLLQGGLLDGRTAPVLQQQAELPLSYPLFADDALVFKHYDFTRLALRSRRSPHFVQMQFDGFPYLGLWTKGPGAAFVCIEPWQGIAGHTGQPMELSDKEGILTLAPGQRYQAAYTIEVG